MGFLSREKVQRLVNIPLVQLFPREQHHLPPFPRELLQLLLLCLIARSLSNLLFKELVKEAVPQKHGEEIKILTVPTDKWRHFSLIKIIILSLSHRLLEQRLLLTIAMNSFMEQSILPPFLRDR